MHKSDNNNNNNFTGRHQKKRGGRGEGRRGRRGRVESRLGETMRIASIIQKGMSTGRSSYVEMRALDRLTKHNIKSKVDALRPHAKPESDLAKLLSIITPAVSGGYVNVLTPNGIVRENELDSLLSIDSDIVMCIRIIESELKKSHKKEIEATIHTLKELVEERKKEVDRLAQSLR
jgi:hypothetical protein